MGIEKQSLEGWMFNVGYISHEVNGHGECTRTRKPNIYKRFRGLWIAVTKIEAQGIPKQLGGQRDLSPLSADV
jgi:hypothetical protein